MPELIMAVYSALLHTDGTVGSVKDYYVVCDDIREFWLVHKDSARVENCHSTLEDYILKYQFDEEPECHNG